MSTRNKKTLICIFLLLGLSGSATAYDELPQLYETTPEDFVCISGYVYDAVTQEPLVGVGVSVFPEGLPADTLEPTGTIHESGVEYPVAQMPGLHWLTRTDDTGVFAICDIPVWLAHRSFSAVVYKRQYIPEFPRALSTDGGHEPLHAQSFGLIPSESQ